MTERSQALAATAVGAVLGGMAGYMLFTDAGRAWRRQLEPALEDVARELMQLRGTVNRAVGLANEGWRVLNEAMGEGTSHSRFADPHQTTPF